MNVAILDDYQNVALRIADWASGGAKARSLYSTTTFARIRLTSATSPRTSIALSMQMLRPILPLGSKPTRRSPSAPLQRLGKGSSELTISKARANLPTPHHQG